MSLRVDWRPSCSLVGTVVNWLAVAMAFADGHFDTAEGEAVKDWAAKFVDELPEGDGREQARTEVNEAIKDAITRAQAGEDFYDQEVQTLNELAGTAEKYAAVELCLDVMAADSVADPNELDRIATLSDDLRIDQERFRELREKRLITVDTASMSGSNIWTELGIAEDSTDDEKRADLRKLYRVWNSRAESLEDPAERSKAQDMLDRIAEARKLLDER